ncbi:hypothetical protein ACR0ST_04370 [Aliidiomarina sp. Khilg15.8]
MIKLNQQVKASEDGVNVITYEPGEHESLPPVAMKHAKAIGAIGDATGETDAEKAAKEAAAKEKADDASEDTVGKTSNGKKGKK